MNVAEPKSMQHISTIVRTLTSCIPAALFVCSLLWMVPSAHAQMYWIDEDQIWKADADGSNPEVLIADTDKPRGLAVDADNERIYWTDDWSFNGEILRANLDGTGTEVLFQQGTPRGIALDVLNGKVYWADLRNDGALLRANLDGSEAETLVAGDTEGETDGILDVALDLEADKVYWTTMGAIMRADLDGSNVEVFADITSFVQPPSIAIDDHGGYVYWINTSQDEIRRASTASAGSAIETVVSADEPAGLAIDAEAGALYWMNSFLFSGGGGNVMRAGLDGSNPEMVLDDLAFPEGPLVVLGGETGTNVEMPSELAQVLSLVDVYPNPFRDRARVVVAVDRAVPVQLELIDVQGRLVSRVDRGVLTPGLHTLLLDGDVASGAYFVRVRGAEASTTKLLMRAR